MDIRLTRKQLYDRCGELSYKTGETFLQKGKVEILRQSPKHCDAVVHGKTDFDVNIRETESGKVAAECSCPKLASVKTDCQHIAAVLLMLKERSISPADRMREIFAASDKRSQIPVQQPRFENRDVLEVSFVLQPVPVSNGNTQLGIHIWVGPDKLLVGDVAGFATAAQKGKAYPVSRFFSYDPERVCFDTNTYALLVLLGNITRNKGVTTGHLMAIPPAYWERCTQCIAKMTNVSLQHSSKHFEHTQLKEEKLPLRFQFAAGQAGSAYLRVGGLDALILLPAYLVAIKEDKIYQLTESYTEQLERLTRMMEGKLEIPIPNSELAAFLSDLAPKLRKLGKVEVSPVISEQFREHKLIPKLFLDRVRDRLLAGLEFHYGQIVINPLEVEEEPMLFRDLEREAEILQLMKESEFTETESGYYLHNEELEYDFLHYQLPKLQKFAQVHATTAVRNRVLTGPFKPKLEVRIKKERTDWLEFKFNMDAIPQEEIKELLQALEEKRKYYRLRNGSLLSLETQEFNKLTEFLNGLSIESEQLTEGFATPMYRGLQVLDGSVLFTPKESFKTFLEELKSPQKLKIKAPIEIVDILRDYQVTGYKWMKTLAHYKFGGILADDMGLGKTIQAITFCLSELEAIREKGEPILIVCPSSLTYNWLSEFSKFAKCIQAIVIDGSPSERALKQTEAMRADVIITSYPLLLKDGRWYEKQYFHTVFFDEAQAFKNATTQTARAARKLNASNRFALTGTPIENSLEELWSLFHVVFPELFGSLRDYSELSRKQIARRVQPFLLRRVKADVLHELPAKIESIEHSELLDEQKKLYGAYLAKLRHDTLKHLNKETIRKNKIRILAGLTRLRQICCHPVLFVDGYTGGSAKFQQLLEILEEAEQSGRKVLVFSQFTSMLKIIGRTLMKQGRDYFYLDGETPAVERLELCNRFNNGESDLFLISLKAGGTGLNLTGADTVILYDTWWNPAVEAQATDRAHRMGQKQTVQVIKLVARGTIEEKMNELQEKKRDLIGEVVSVSEAGKAYALTDEDIEWLIGGAGE